MMADLGRDTKSNNLRALVEFRKKLDQLRNGATSYFHDVLGVEGDLTLSELPFRSSDAPHDHYWRTLPSGLQEKANSLADKLQRLSVALAEFYRSAPLMESGVWTAANAMHLALALRMKHEVSDTSGRRWELGALAPSNAEVRFQKNLDRLLAMLDVTESALKERPEPQLNSAPLIAWWKRLLIILGLGSFLAVTSVGVCWLGDEKWTKENVLLVFVGLSAFLATAWAIQSYWRLVKIDERDKAWRPPAISEDWSGPYAFHALAQSHKEWAQLWFSWCVAIFLGGVTYATYNSGHQCPTGAASVSDVEHVTRLVDKMFSVHIHHALVYALFAVAWYWASRHYRSHWHNYVTNAYRHRSLYRFQLLREELWGRVDDHKFASRADAEKTILELYRLSGVALLMPGDSSYLEKHAGQDVHAEILRMEGVAEAFASKGRAVDKH